jgi:hypothetical protein
MKPSPTPIPRWKRRLNKCITTTVTPVIPGQHPHNCPFCRGTKLVWYADRRHGMVQMPCPAFSKLHHPEPETFD